MKGNKIINKDKIKQMVQIFQLIFSKTEIEIIKYISIFLTLIYPKVTIETNSIFNDIIREFKRFVIKLCLFLLGYNLDKVNALSDKRNMSEMNDTKKLILILEFCIFFSFKDETLESQNNNIEWITKYLKLKSEYENNEIIDMDDDIMLFFNKKPKNELVSFKHFFIVENV